LSYPDKKIQIKTLFVVNKHNLSVFCNQEKPQRSYFDLQHYPDTKGCEHLEPGTLW